MFYKQNHSFDVFHFNQNRAYRIKPQHRVNVNVQVAYASFVPY